ncbi:uncharacterized protein LOC120332512 [Styela clava]
MMGGRTTIFQLCRRLALCNDTVSLHQVTPITTRCDSLIVSSDCSNTKFIRHKSTATYSEEVLENEERKKFSSKAEEEEYFNLAESMRRRIQPNRKRQFYRSEYSRDKSDSRFNTSEGYDYEDDDRFSSRTRRDNSFSNDYSGSETRSMEDLWTELNQKKIDFGDVSELTKNVYTEHPDVTNRPKEEVLRFLGEHQITITGKNKKNPILSFNETCFSDEVSLALEKMEFTQPTPIQSIGWPHALSGNDIVGIAQTGSGKTLSFILPAIQHITEQRKTLNNNAGPIALVLCPTRELALQCQDVVKKFHRVCRINSVAVYGGQSKIIQEDQLHRPKLDLIIATPGRLLDFLTLGVVSLRHCSFAVLDEADRMLDMGFEPQIRSLMGQIRPDRQVLMWSATWPEEIQDLASDFLKDYMHVKIGSQQHTVNADITHEFQYCMSHEKVALLLDHLQANPDDENKRHCAKTLVFCATKSQCSRLQGILRREGFYVDSLHGDKSQSQRDFVMRNYRSGRISVLIASDVAARGLDVSDIQFVVNYDLPNNIDSYIHRVGRTARAGKKGKAISFITVEDLDMARPLINVLEDVDHPVPDILHHLTEKRKKMRTYKRTDNRMNRRNSYPRY